MLQDEQGKNDFKFTQAGHYLPFIIFRSHPSSGSVNLFGGQPLGLFTKASDTKDPLETWSKLEQRELKLAVTHPPSNYFGKISFIVRISKYYF